VPINAILERTLVVGLPVLTLLGFSLARFARAKTPSALVQLLGAGCLIVVVLTHVAEACTSSRRWVGASRTAPATT
jgi:hypothetical protein